MDTVCFLWGGNWSFICLLGEILSSRLCLGSRSYLMASYSRVQVQSWASLHEIGGDQNGTWTAISMSTLVYPCHYHATGATYSFSSTCSSYQEDKWQSVGTSKNQCCCGNRGALDRKVLSLFSIFKGPVPMNTASILAHSCHDDTVTMSVGPPYVAFLSCCHLKLKAWLLQKQIWFF